MLFFIVYLLHDLLPYLQTQKCFFLCLSIPVPENLSAIKSTISCRAAAVWTFLGADVGIQGSPVFSSTAVLWAGSISWDSNT